MNNKYSLIVGIGKTGLSIANYLQYKKQPFAVYDTRANPAGIEELFDLNPDILCYLVDIPPSVLSEVDAIYMSPGVSLDIPLIQQAIQQGIPVLGDIECLSKEINSPIIAITGTNGKSTVTTLVGEMVKHAGFNAAVGGNLGTPVLDLLLDKQNYDCWVLELSSFQLDLTHKLSPCAATILNITPDHLDRHHSFDAYKAAKHRIYNSAAAIIYNREDLSTYPSSTTNDCEIISFGLDTPTLGNWGLVDNNGLAIAFGSEIIVHVDELKIKGRHNWSNAVAACALAQRVGVNFAVMRAVLRDFTGLSHRTAHIRQLDGVDWIDDSKGTNVGATNSAITGIGAAMRGKIILIAGGQGKGSDFRILREAVSQYVRSVIVIGEDASIIQNALADLVEVNCSDSLKDAVSLASVKAVIGDVVLLSPACASFDMFRDFNHRGEVFKELVCAL